MFTPFVLPAPKLTSIRYTISKVVKELENQKRRLLKKKEIISEINSSIRKLTFFNCLLHKKQKDLLCIDETCKSKEKNICSDCRKLKHYNCNNSISVSDIFSRTIVSSSQTILKIMEMVKLCKSHNFIFSKINELENLIEILFCSFIEATPTEVLSQFYVLRFVLNSEKPLSLKSNLFEELNTNIDKTIEIFDLEDENKFNLLNKHLLIISNTIGESIQIIVSSGFFICNNLSKETCLHTENYHNSTIYLDLP